MSSESFDDLNINSNISDDELILRECKYKFLKLKSQYNEEIILKENLLLLNEKNENILKSLRKIKKDYEAIKSDLKRSYLSISITTDKEKIICDKKLNEFLEKRKYLQEQNRKSPLMFELEDLIIQNDSLVESCRNISSLYELTKKQYKEMMESLMSNFRVRICEVCDIVVKHHLLND